MEFTTPNVMNLTGASKMQLHHWATSGLCRPSRHQAKGTGTRRIYTFKDVIGIRMIVELRRQGCSLQKVRKAARHLKSHYPNESDESVLSRVLLVTDGHAVYIKRDDQIADVLSKQTAMFVVPVGNFIIQAKQQADVLPMKWTEQVRVKGNTYHLRLARDVEGGGFIGQCIELPGSLSQGETPEETIANGKDAIETTEAFLARHDRAMKGAKAS